MTTTSIRYAPSADTTWAKLVTGLSSEITRGVHAFEGRYLRRANNRLNVGAIVIEINGQQEARILRVHEGELRQIEIGGVYHWRRNFGDLRQAVGRLLADAHRPAHVQQSLEEIAAESQSQRPSRRRRREEARQQRQDARAKVREIILAGAAADGSGALLGWEGCGIISHADLAAVCASVGMADLAPSPRSAISHAGEAIMRLNNSRDGLIARRDTVAEGSTVESRGYVAQWFVNQARSKAKRGEPGSDRILTAVLHANGDLEIDGPAALAEQIQSRYTTRRDAEIYRAGDVTSWLTGVLKYEFGCAKHVLGYYVTAGQRANAERLMDALDACSWGLISPPLSVATGDELAAGIAKGFIKGIERIEGSLEVAKAKATKDEKPSISSSEAAKLLADLADLDNEADTYRAILGDAVVTPLVTRIRALRDELSPLTDDASIRFSLLELDDSSSEPVAPAAPSPAEKAAEAATEARHAEVQAEAATEGPTLAEYKLRYRAAMESTDLNPRMFRAECEKLMNGDQSPAAWTEAAEAVVASLSAPVAPPAPLPHNDTDERFSNLELD